MKEKNSSFKAINPSKIKISNNNNLIQNNFSTKKLISNLKITNKESKEKENIARAESDYKLGNLLSKKKNLYSITSNSFRKKIKMK